MPIYEYHCPDCDRTFETLARLGEGDAPIRCPVCGEVKARRCLSAPAATRGDSAGGDFGGFAAPSGGCGSGGFT